MTTVEARVVNPVANRASMETVNVTDTDMVDTALKQAEEDKMLEDEEIDSCEGEDLENQMLTVALVTSVVDAGIHNVETKENQQPRYGLRKRRRPGDTASSETEEPDPKKTGPSFPAEGDPDAPTIQGISSNTQSEVQVKAEVKEELDDKKQHDEEPPGTNTTDVAGQNAAKQEKLPESETVKQDTPVHVPVKQEDTPVHVPVKQEDTPVHVTVKQEDTPVHVSVMQEDTPVHVSVMQETSTDIEPSTTGGTRIEELSGESMLKSEAPIAQGVPNSNIKPEEEPIQPPKAPAELAHPVVAPATTQVVASKVEPSQPPIVPAERAHPVVAPAPTQIVAIKEEPIQPPKVPAEPAHPVAAPATTQVVAIKKEPIQPPKVPAEPAHPVVAPVSSQVFAPVKIQSKPVAAPQPQRPPASQHSTHRQTYTPSVPMPLNAVVPAAKASSPPVEPTLKEEELVPTSGAVPNPLSQSTPPPSAVLPRRYVTTNSALPASAPEISVPCPLPASVPCPLQLEPPDVAADKRVTINEPPVPTTRGRIFSVDLDPSTFDFSDMGGDHNEPDKGDHAVDVSVLPRDRAFSFEFFNFGDDLLPAPYTSSSELPDPAANSDTEEHHVIMRPRGDSIIFDPVSFQDGGIHEKNALLKVNASLESAPELLADPRLATACNHLEPELPKLPITTPNPLPYNVVSRDPGATTGSGQIATLPSALNGSSSNVSSPATFQMELLNKDGRIGIYLPDARIARIARFHAKRKMRIWRKRIKYDCRKKLADSRPRIKGRFVKRSDMDE